MLRRRDKRRYLLVYVDEQICKCPSQLMDGSADIVYDPINSQIISRENMSSNSQEEYKNNNNNTLHKKNKKYNNRNNNININSHYSRLIKKRFSELFGSIEFEKASISLIDKKNLSLKNCFIIKCNLKCIDKVLFALSCCNPPLTTIKISGTLKKLTSFIEI